jgi:hypothetical protein
VIRLGTFLLSILLYTRLLTRTHFFQLPGCGNLPPINDYALGNPDAGHYLRCECRARVIICYEMIRSRVLEAIHYDDMRCLSVNMS